MPIQFITGLPRAGKTLWTLTHIKARSEKENRKVYYCNIPGVTIPGWEEIDHPDKWLELPDGAIIVVDELQDFWGKQPTGSRVPPPILELSKHGKRGFDFYFITQEPNLVHSTPRDLCAHHWYVVRAWGAQAAAVYRFERMQVHPEKVKSKGEKFPWVYNKEAYGWYKSADMHNIKREIPKKIIAIPFIILFTALMIGAAIWAFQWTMGKAKGENKVDQTKVAVAPGGVNAPGAAAGPARALGPLNTAEYVKSYQPRLAGLAHTAPAYDELTRPKQVPMPAACVESKSGGCKCYTQQATPYDTSPEICRQIVRNGLFLAFLEPPKVGEASRSEKPPQADLSIAARTGGGGAMVIPSPAPNQTARSILPASSESDQAQPRVQPGSKWSFSPG